MTMDVGGILIQDGCEPQEPMGTPGYWAPEVHQLPRGRRIGSFYWDVV